jgi:hypothetical protein
MIIGYVAGGRWRTVSFYLLVSALAAFLVRQPLTLAVKAYSGRRSRSILPAVWFWIAVYAVIGSLHVAGLVFRGYGYLLYLALPGVPVFGWFLMMVSRREERQQRIMEIAATGALALTAPAAMWVGLGRPDPMGWLLWILTWAQSSASILHAYLRLQQRTLDRVPGAGVRIRLASGALLFTGANLTGVLGAGIAGLVPLWLAVPYAVQWCETIYGAARPAIGFKPVAIGLRQLAVSTIFTALFILAWRI